MQCKRKTILNDRAANLLYIFVFRVYLVAQSVILSNVDLPILGNSVQISLP